MTKIFIALALFSLVSCASFWNFLPNTAVEVVTSGLVLHLDASKFDGSSFPGTGCGSLTWQDLTANNNDAALQNCSSGLQGDGSTGSPYRVDFDGTNDQALISSPSGDSLDLVAGEDVTICALHYPVQNGDDAAYHFIIGNRSGGDSLWELYLQSSDTGAVNCGTAVGASSGWFSYNGGAYSLCNSNSVVPKNAWHLTCVQSEDGGATSTIRHYHNGVENGTDTYTSTNRYGNAAWDVSIGTLAGGEQYQGDIAWIGVYSRALTQAEHEQNCDALSARVTGITCP